MVTFNKSVLLFILNLTRYHLGVDRDTNSVQWTFHKLKAVKSKVNVQYWWKVFSHRSLSTVICVLVWNGMKRSRPRESTIRGFHSLLLCHGAALLFRCLWKALIKLALTGRETRPSATNSSVGPINRFVADSLQSADQLDPRWRRDELPNGAVVLTFYSRFANSMVNNVALWTFKMPLHFLWLLVSALSFLSGCSQLWRLRRMFL